MAFLILWEFEGCTRLVCSRRNGSWLGVKKSQFPSTMNARRFVPPIGLLGDEATIRRSSTGNTGRIALLTQIKFPAVICWIKSTLSAIQPRSEKRELNLEACIG
jgi:hypothetical protein